MNTSVETPLRSPLTLQRSVILLGAVLLVVALLIAGVLLLLQAVPGLRDSPLAVAAWLFPAHAVAVLAVIALLLRRWGVTWRALGFAPPGAGLLHLVWQVPLLLVAGIVAQGLASSLLGPPPDRPDTVGLLAGGGLGGLVPVVAIGVVVLVPIWEEAVFRGVVRGGLRRRFPARIAVLGSALLFAVAHGVPLLMPYLFVVGVGLGVLVEVHRTLWASVIAHAALNGLVTLVALRAVAG